MLFSEGLTELADRFSKKIDDGDFLAKAKLKFNLAYQEVGKSWNWIPLLRYGSIVAIPIYKTGSASITTGSYTVTLTGGASADA